MKYFILEKPSEGAIDDQFLHRVASSINPRGMVVYDRSYPIIEKINELLLDDKNEVYVLSYLLHFMRVNQYTGEVTLDKNIVRNNNVQNLIFVVTPTNFYGLLGKNWLNAVGRQTNTRFMLGTPYSILNILGKKGGLRDNWHESFDEYSYDEMFKKLTEKQKRIIAAVYDADKWDFDLDTILKSIYELGYEVDYYDLFRLVYSIFHTTNLDHSLRAGIEKIHNNYKPSLNYKRIAPMNIPIF